ncbi:MAG: TolC family protein [Myxococcaceae bacterium]
MRLWPAVLALLFAMKAAAQVPLPPAPPLPLPRLTSAPDPTLGTPAVALDGGVDGVTPVVQSIGFQQAVDQALARNPSTLTALQEVARIRGLMEEVRAASIPTLAANVAFTHLDGSRTEATIAGPNTVIYPQNQWTGNIQLNIPLLSPTAWANAIRAGDQVEVARYNSADVRRVIATNTAKTYIALIAQKRQVEVNVLSRDTAVAQLDYAKKRLAGGLGNKVDAARAAQTLESAEVILQASYEGLYNAQEALGVLLGDTGPVDASETPNFPQLPGLDAALSDAPKERTDIRLNEEQVKAADRSLNMSWMEYLPTLNLLGEPLFQHPPTPPFPEWGWQIQAQLSWTIFDGGARYGRTHQREAQLAENQITLEGTSRQVLSDVRTSFDSVKRSVRALDNARRAAAYAVDTYRLADLSYKAGASNNLDLIQAFLAARDAATQAVIAEDALRQSALDLLVAAGRFP